VRVDCTGHQVCCWLYQVEVRKHSNIVLVMLWSWHVYTNVISLFCRWTVALAGWWACRAPLMCTRTLLKNVTATNSPQKFPFAWELMGRIVRSPPVIMACPANGVITHTCALRHPICVFGVVENCIQT
jgi:hypothetical protein